MATQPTNNGNGIQSTITGIQNALNQIAQSAKAVFNKIRGYSAELAQYQVFQQQRVTKKAMEADLEKIRNSNNSAKERERIELEYFKKLQSQYKKNGKKYKEMQKEIDRINEASAKRPTFFQGLKEGLSGGGAFGKLLGRINLLALATKAFQKVQQLLTEAIVGSFKAAVDFEAQLAQLQAVTGINNKELKRLEKSILDVAGSTKFTSEEIVLLQTELGKLGFSVDEIADSTLAVAETAQALGEKVAPVAQKIGQILNQYNLQASETVNISDTLVSTINSSALSFEGFGTALQYIGPLGAEVGTTFRETSTAMAILADNGFTASRIGTGLRGILTELSSTGKDLITVVKELAEEEISLSEAVELVGKRNAAQLISLIDNVDVLSDLENKYYSVGAAAIASAQQVDTYAGNLDLLKSAFNRVQIEFGNFLKYTGLLKLGLRILDKEGLKTAQAMGFLSNVDPTLFSEGLDKAAENFVALGGAANEFKDRNAIANKEAEKLYRDVLTPLQREYLENEERLAEIDKFNTDNYGKLGEFSQEYRDSLAKEETALRARQEVIKDYKITEEERLAIQENIADQIQRQGEQLRLQNARDVIEENYKEQLEEFQALRDNENMTLEEGLALRTSINAKEDELRAVLKDQKTTVEDRKKTLQTMIKDGDPQEAIDRAKEDVRLAEVRLEQYQQELTNLVNTNISKEELFSLAQKEYEVEFGRLRNKIAARKQELKAETDLLDLKIKTNQEEIDSLAIQIQNTTDKEKQAELAEKQKKLIEEQTQTEAQRARLQQAAYSDVNSFVSELEDKLEYQNQLWKDAGFKPDQLRILEKANERLTAIGQSLAEMELDLPEAISAAENLAKSLQDRFKDTLKDGGMLSEADQEEINKAIADTFKDFNLTPEQQEAISAYIFSSLKPGKKTEDDLKKEAKKLAEFVLGEVAEAAEEYNKTALENTTNRLRSELAAVKNRYKTEEDILKSQLDNQLITESQFRAKQKEIRKKQLQEENEINRKIFEAQKKADLRSVAIDTFEAIASNVIENFGTQPTGTAAVQSALGYAAIVAAGAAKADAIRRRQFFPVQFEEGGFVTGPSHAQGGVPFTVQGQGGYEMEGGEFIVNKKAAAFHRSLLERINGSYKPNTNIQPMQFAQGGLVEAQRAAQINVNAHSEESVNYLKAIAHATISTATDMKKPTRAFITSKDLSNNETERRLRERNDRI